MPSRPSPRSWSGKKIELTSASDRCDALAGNLEDWLEQKLADQVYWMAVEPKHGRQPKVTLACAPVEVGPALRQQLFGQVPTVVLTSATLSIGGPGGFDHFQQRLGAVDCETLQLGSPFNYRQQAE